RAQRDVSLDRRIRRRRTAGAGRGDWRRVAGPSVAQPRAASGHSRVVRPGELVRLRARRGVPRRPAGRTEGTVHHDRGWYADAVRQGLNVAREGGWPYVPLSRLGLRMAIHASFD